LFAVILTDSFSLGGLVKANGTPHVKDEFGDFHGAGAQAASAVRSSFISRFSVDLFWVRLT
jgi:hypothetical protein